MRVCNGAHLADITQRYPVESKGPMPLSAKMANPLADLGTTSRLAGTSDLSATPIRWSATQAATFISSSGNTGKGATFA